MGKFAFGTLFAGRASEVNRHQLSRRLATDPTVRALAYDARVGASAVFEGLSLTCDRHDQPLGGPKKRVLDVTLALAALILTAPIMLLVAAVIRVFMGGPIVFAQRRVGYRGRTFTLYKFRTMTGNARELLERHLAASPEAAREWHTARKLAKDPRVNGLGRILRKSSLDELPQLFNVLRGDMSLVGPRPIVLEEVCKYGCHVHAYLTGRPGITGIWQTSGRNSLSYPARVACDRYYARHWSVWLDLALLLKTIPAVLKFDQTA